MTNSENVRQMSDEELAESYAKIAMCTRCNLRYSCKNKDEYNCKITVLKWLKVEATQND